MESCLVLKSFHIQRISPHPKPSPQGARDFQSLDGAMSADGLVWGTYIHGVFDQPGFRREWLNRVRGRKNLQALDMETSQAVSNRLVHAIDRWADHVGTYLNMKPIFSAIEFRKDNASLKLANALKIYPS